MLVPVILFMLGFALLIKGGDWFVDGSVGLAHRFRLPELLIGATVVSIGTTLPEVMVSSQAAIEGNAGISYGNAIGSVICNTCLIAALTVAIRPGKVDPKTFRLPTAFFFLAALSYALVAWTAGRFPRWMGVVYLCVFVGYMILSIVQMKKHPELAEEEEAEDESAPQPLWKELLLLVVGAAAIALGARFLVDNGTLIAAALGVPDSVIGLTMVAGADHRDHEPHQGARRALARQRHRRQPLQHHPRQRHGDHDLALRRPGGEDDRRLQFQPHHRSAGDARRDGDPLPAPAAKREDAALAGRAAAVRLRRLHGLSVRVLTRLNESEAPGLYGLGLRFFEGLRFLIQGAAPA